MRPGAHQPTHGIYRRVTVRMYGDAETLGWDAEAFGKAFENACAKSFQRSCVEVLVKAYGETESRREAESKQAGSKKPEQEKEERSLALSAKPTIPCSYQRGRQLTRWRPCPRQVRSSIRGPATGVPSTMTMRPAAALIHAAPWFGTVSRVCAKCALRLLSHLMTPINPSPAASISPTPLGYRRETMFWITAASGRPTNAMLTVGWAPKYAVTAAARTDKAPKPTPSQWPRRKSVMAASRALDS